MGDFIFMNLKKINPFYYTKHLKRFLIKKLKEKINGWLISANKSAEYLSSPEICVDKFCSRKLYPIYSNQIQLFSRAEYNKTEYAVIIQGQIIEQNNFTVETLKTYKKLFGSKVRIIFSTWVGLKRETEEYLKQLDIYIVKSKIPEKSHQNIGCQIISTVAGLKKAKEFGCKYVIKSRSDQRIYSSDVIETCRNLQKKFLLKSKDKNLIKERLIICSRNTYKYRLYGVSDFFMFGYIDDLFKYWNIDWTKYPKVKCSWDEYFKYFCPETFICQQFLKKIGYKINNDLKDTLCVYRDLFIIIDRQLLELFWFKYSNALDSRFEKFKKNMLEEFKFKDWINIQFSD